MPDKVREILAVNIKRYRASYGYSQMKLAEIAGLSTSLIASIETLKKFPSSVSINKLSKAFGIDPYQLFKEESSTTDKLAKLGALKEELKADITKQIESSFRNFFQGK